MEKKIIGTFPLTGASTAKTFPSYETQGFAGEACQEATKSFEAALGAVVSDAATAEMYEQEDRHEFLQEGGDEE